MTSKQWQLASDSAQRYQAILVPAILGAFAKALVDWADLDGAETVVDIGCGTGAATRFAAEKLGASSKVIGIDVNEGMLAVAQSLPPTVGAPIEWRQENAYDLTLEDESVDLVFCAQSLQFMPNRQTALTEIHRILKSAQSVYLSLWCPIEESPYFSALVAAIATHIDEDTASGLGTAFNLSQLDEITRLLEEAQFSEIVSEIAVLDLQLAPIPDFVPRHISATPMGKSFQASSASTQQAILDELANTLSQYQNAEGIKVPFRSYLIKAQK